MGRFIVRRLLSLIPVFFGITLIAFFAVRLIPGDAATAILKQEARPELVAQIRQTLGIDRPLHVQLIDWFAHLSRLDFGKSFVSGRPVLPDILDKLPATLELAFFATLISAFVAIPLGILTAIKRGSIWDYIERFFSLAGLSIPSFWLALILILVFALKLRWLPAVGYVSFLENPLENLRRVMLPSISLGVGMAAVVARYTRSSLLDVLSQDYMRTAKGKGLNAYQVIVSHGLKNAMIPVVTTIGMQLGTLIGQTVIVESIFVWPGLGQFTLQAIYDRDYPIVQAMVIVFAFFFVIINLAVDIIYSFLDPRIRYE